MNRAVLVVLVAGFTLAGCTSRYRRANELAKQGQFVAAAEMFEQLAREKPNDKELPELLQRARYRAVEHALGKARQYRLTENPSASQRSFAEGLALRQRWNLRLGGALEQTIDDEREDAERRLRAQVFPHADKGEALAAESIVERHGFLLQHAELGALRSELTDRARASGAGTCKNLLETARPGEPYWTDLVAAYCKHFGAQGPAERPLPDTLSRVHQDLRVDGLGDGLTGALWQLLEAKVQRSPWFSADQGGLESATLAVRGSSRQSQRETPMVLGAEWHEQVPYVEHVKTTLETTTPIVECESYEESAPNAPGGTVTKTRQVERRKTTTKEVIVPKTRFRTVPRTFEYQALRVERRILFDTRAELSAGGQLAASAGLQSQDVQDGYLHEISFEPAGVRPTRPRFGPPELWLGTQAHGLAERFAEALREGWRSRFCQLASPSVEEAARCARAVTGVPKPAIEALKGRLGEDAAYAPALLSNVSVAPPSS